MTETWLPDLSRSGVKYQAIVDALAAAVAAGELRPGERLPPQRDLATALGVDLTTVTKAYGEARGRGLIEARGRAGSFVRDPGEPAALEEALADTGMNMPPEVQGGSLPPVWGRTMAALLRSPRAAARLQYQPPGGTMQDRAAGAGLFEKRGFSSGEDQVVVTAGGQNALHAIVSAALRPGDAVLCGPFVYPGFLGLAQRFGLELVALPQQDAEAIEQACKGRRIAALYIVPTNDNPTTATLDADQRHMIASLAERHGFQIIEDDAYGLLPADPLPPLACFAPDRSWHIASTSKIISPALRVAYVRAPSVGDALRLSGDVHETSVMAPPLNAAMVTAWLQDGTFDRLIAETRAEAEWRQALATATLEQSRFAAHPQGYHLWLQLPEGANAAELVNRLRPQGLSLVSSDSFAIEPATEQFLRVSLGGAVGRDRLERNLRMLHGYLAPSRGHARTIV